MGKCSTSMFLVAVGVAALALAPVCQAQVGIFEKTADWSGRGSFKAPGSIEVVGTGATAVYTIKGNGDDIWDNTDEGFFAYTELEGASSISAKVKWITAKGGDITGGNDWGKIGVMIREAGADPTSKHYWIEMRCGPGEPALGDRTDAQWREQTGGSSGNVQIFMPDGTTNVFNKEGIWLRVSRNPANNVCVSEYSFDGKTWVVANAKVMPMQAKVAYGVAITNHVDNDFLNVGEVTDVYLGPAAKLAMPPKPDDFSARALSTFWTALNMGAGPKNPQTGSPPGTATKGRARPVNGELQITNNGWDIWDDQAGDGDGMGYVYQVVAGDFDVAVRVVAFDGNLDGDPTCPNRTDPNGGNEWEKAGIAFRQSLDPKSPYVSSLLSRSHGLRGQYRLTLGGTTNRARRGDDGSGPKAGWWARLKRTGDVFEILTAESLDGPWLPLNDQLDRGLPNNTLKIADPAFLGICYTPHSTDNVAVFDGTCILDDFVVMGPELGIFEASLDIDDGRLGAPGSAKYDAATGTYTIEGSGWDVWETGDDFHFLYKEWSGDFTLSADVSVVGGLATQQWIKAMLMARQNLTPGSPYIATRVRKGGDPAAGFDGQYSTQWRTTQGGSSSSTAGALRVTGQNPGRHRLERVGDTFNTYYQAADGTWKLVDSNKVVLTDPILVGLGVCAHDIGAVAVGTFKNVELIGPVAVDWESHR